MLGLPTVHPNHRPADHIHHLSTQAQFEKWRKSDENSVGVVEVHPAFALAIWWLEKHGDNNAIFQKYKGRNIDKDYFTKLKTIAVEQWGILNAAPDNWNDDHLDAYVGLKLGIGLRKGSAKITHANEGGSFLLPKFPDAFPFPPPNNNQPNEP